MLGTAKVAKTAESEGQELCREPTQARRLPFLNKSCWHMPYVCKPVLPAAVCMVVGDKKL